MKLWSFLLSIIFWSYLEVAIFLLALISYVIPQRLFCFLLRLACQGLFLVSLIKVKKEGFGKIPKDKRLIFIANKPNLVSTFALIAYFPAQLRFVAAPKLFRIPFLGRIVKAMGCVPAVTDKKNSFVFINRLTSCLKAGQPVLFYPQNLRLGDSRVGKFKPEEFKIAGLCQATTVTLAVVGSEKIIPPASAFISPGQITIKVDTVLDDYNSIGLETLLPQLEDRFKELLGEKHA